MSTVAEFTADDLHGNGQGDVLTNHGPDPEASWTRWADFANKVYHVWPFGAFPYSLDSLERVGMDACQVFDVMVQLTARDGLEWQNCVGRIRCGM
eukprot:3715095-Amphidinium_carterae.1